MQLTKSHIALCVSCMIAGVLLGAGFRSCGRKQVTPEPIVLHDTISFRDTLRIEGKTKTIRTVDSVVVIERDTVKDTIYLPFDTRLYADSIVTDTSRIAWAVKYSGYKAKIDSFGLDYHFLAPTKTIDKKRGWGQFVGIGIGAGYGASVIGNNQVYAAPSVGVSIVYGWGYHW